MPIGVTGYTLLVGASGFAVPALKNALLKHPVMFRPWQHATGLALGAYVGYRVGTVSDAVWRVMEDEKAALLELRRRVEGEADAEAA
eukprot:CAMPEP_0203806882 /NCGR_PEP_ID=MMETSP0115-20131106/757_1 /ASSEMBLY_ACC=CAM_ASM_000227 /TAXON_ID=33651 /ORGANISM="Bicosoecid sp, Strain ms1" /LENGTH=86 /DNA_ID=CAMNT_0050715549 /DNA_START=9 /DNA_END=269 /DNA_ORIENTATION=+